MTPTTAPTAAAVTLGLLVERIAPPETMDVPVDEVDAVVLVEVVCTELVKVMTLDEEVVVEESTVTPPRSPFAETSAELWLFSGLSVVCGLEATAVLL